MHVLERPHAFASGCSAKVFLVRELYKVLEYLSKLRWQPLEYNGGVFWGMILEIVNSLLVPNWGRKGIGEIIAKWFIVRFYLKRWRPSVGDLDAGMAGYIVITSQFMTETSLTLYSVWYEFVVMHISDALTPKNTISIASTVGSLLCAFCPILAG